MAVLLTIVLLLAFQKYNTAIANFLITRIIEAKKKNIEGDLLYRGLDSRLYGEKIYLEISELIIVDKQRIQVLEANNTRLIYPLTNLFRQEQVFDKLDIDSLKINAIRDREGKWNIASVLRPSTKKYKYKIKNLSFPKIIVDIEDIMSFKKIRHDFLSIKIKSKNLDNIYDVFVLANPPEQNLESDNFVQIKGSIDLNSRNYQERQDSLSIQVRNLNMLDLSFVLDLLDNYKSQYILNLFNKYAHEASLDLSGSISSKGKNLKNITSNISIKNLYHIPLFTIKTNFDFQNSENLVINNLAIQFLNSELQLKGLIKNFDKNKETYNLNFQTKAINFEDLQKRIDEFNQDQYRLVLSFLKGFQLEQNLDSYNLIHGDRDIYTIDSTIKFKSNENLKIKTKIDKDLLIIEDLKIPINTNQIQLYGKYGLKTKFLDINLESKDLSLDRIKLFLQGFDFFDKYADYFAKAITGGQANIKLNLHKDNHCKTGLSLSGFLKTNKAFYYSDAIKIPIQNLNANIKIENNNFIIQNLNSFIGTSYVEAKGNYDFNDNSKTNLEIASPQINLSSFKSSDIFNQFLANHKINNLMGFINDFYISFKNNHCEALADCKNLSFVLDQKINLDEINGRLNLKDENFNLKNLNLKINKSSSVKIHGNIEKDFKKPKLIIGLYNFDLAQIKNLQDFVPILKNIEEAEGRTDSEFYLNGTNLIGNFSLKNSNVSLVKNKWIKYPFKDLNAEIYLGKDLVIKEAKANYGKSIINALTLVIKNYKDKEPHYQTNFDGKVDYNEIKYLLPAGITGLNQMGGLLPLTFSLAGPGNKLDIQAIAQIGQLDKYMFSNWLNIDKSKNQDIKISSHFIITPKIIYSRNTQLNFNGLNSSPITVSAKFQINDWSNKNNLNYQTSFIAGDKLNDVNLNLLVPHLISLKPLNLESGRGFFGCDTHGNSVDRQTFCDFKINTPSIAHKYGIGDLKTNNAQIRLISLNYKPLFTQITLNNGDWNGIDFEKVSSDIEVNGTLLKTNNLYAQLDDISNIQGYTDFNFQTLVSNFKLEGDQVSANQLVQGIWGLGAEVPEGKVSGVFEGSTKGYMPDDMFFNLKGKANIIVRDGKLSQLKTMQKILTAANTVKNFDINNIFQILITYKGGLFNYLISSLDYDMGKISSKKVLLKSDSIELDLSGYIDYAKDRLEIETKGLIPRYSKSILQTIGLGQANLGNLLSLANLRSNAQEKSFFEFQMIGPASNMETSFESVKASFRWSLSPNFEDKQELLKN